MRRVLRAYARRVGDGDVEALVLMANLADEIDTAMAEAVKGLRGCGSPEQARARCVPDGAVGRGYSRSLADAPTYPLNCTWTGPGMPAYVLLSSRSRVRVAVEAQLRGLEPNQAAWREPRC